jgi:DNA-binding response OmpR family regulator
MNKVLIIEDDTLLANMYRDKFVQEGFDVQTAIDGEDGLKKMQTFQPSAIILDLVMPKVSGYDVLKTTKHDPILSKIPILVLTNIYADVESLTKEWGAKAVLLKSNYTPEDILTKIKELIQSA